MCHLKRSFLLPPSSLLAMFIIALLGFVLPTTGFAKGGKTQVTVDTTASTWISFPADTSVLPAGCTAHLFPSGGDCLPIGGAGQLNGGFTIAERDGIEIGLRATDRTDGLLTPTGTRKGVYRAATGYDDAAETRAEWNYDIHIDLRDTDKTLGDYIVTFHQTFAPKLDGAAGPVNINPNPPGVLNDLILFQTSQNPVFGNDTFDVMAEGDYNLMLKLRPKGGGPPLIVKIQVLVRNE